MPDCNFQSRLSAYHDGELDTETAAELKRHLPSCAACGQALEEIRQLSRLFADVRTPALAPAALERVHDAVDGGGGSIILPTARLLVGLAASVLIIAGIWLHETPRPGPGNIAAGKPPAEWERVAQTLHADPLPGQSGIDVPAEARASDAERTAEYMLEQLGAKDGSAHE